MSPWESRFSLWYRKKGIIPATPDNDAMSRGRRLEPVVASWFADEHPEYRVRRTGTWANRHRPWQIATPDRVLYARNGRGLLEIKTSTEPDEWGTPGTDEVPIFYRCQVMWQLDTMGLSRAYVAVLTSRLDFREYVVDWNATEAEVLRAEAREFLDTLDRDERPDLDEHGATYRTVRELHPDIDDVEVEIDPALAERYRVAVAEHKVAEAAKQRATVEVLDVLGTAPGCGRRRVDRDPGARSR